MGKEEILKWINSRHGRKYLAILRFCEEPKVFDTRTWETATTLTMQDMGDIIKNMMSAGGMEFNDGKWKTTKIAQELIKDKS